MQTVPLDGNKKSSEIITQSVFVDGTQGCLQRSLMQKIYKAEEMTAEVYHVGAMEVLNMQLPDKRVFNKEGYLASIVLITRTVAMRTSSSSPKKRYMNEHSETTVLDVIVIDKTGPVLVSLWGSIVNTLEKLMIAFRYKVGPNSSVKPLVLFENLKAATWVSSSYNGEILSSMNHLRAMHDAQNHSLTKVSFLRTPTAACMTTHTFNMPQSSVVVTQFAILEDRAPPYCISVAGVAMDVSAAIDVSAENPKRNLKIVDRRGFWLRCVIVGEQALRTSLVDGVKAVFFFGHARAGTSTSEGALFMFYASRFIVLEKSAIMPRLEGQSKLP